MTRLAKIFSLFTVGIILSFSLSHAQQAKSGRLEFWPFLLGEWQGEGSGDPGQGRGSFSFSYDLSGHIVIRKNHAEYPATKDRPAFVHDDVMIVYPQEEMRAIYFDNEGHVINYSISQSKDSLIFISEGLPMTPRYRLTYARLSSDAVRIIFEIAPPGQPESFSRYIEAVALRK